VGTWGDGNIVATEDLGDDFATWPVNLQRHDLKSPDQMPSEISSVYM